MLEGEGLLSIILYLSCCGDCSGLGLKIMLRKGNADHNLNFSSRQKLRATGSDCTARL